MARRDLARRVAALETAVRAAGNLAARVEALNPAERAAYSKWRKAADAYHAQFSQPHEAYAAFLDGVTGPALPYWIKAKLYDPAPTITITDTDASAVEKYRKLIE